MDLTQQQQQTVSDALADIFPEVETREITLDKPFLVSNLNTEQFVKINDLLIENNLNIYMKRSGGSISILIG